MIFNKVIILQIITALIKVSMAEMILIKIIVTLINLVIITTSNKTLIISTI